jgi:ATP-dependent helicase HrpB
VAHRLWSTSEQARLAPQCSPSITSADLAPLVLQLAAWGGSVDDKEVWALPWLDPPPAAALARARQLLLGLGALRNEEDGARVVITRHGEALASLPTHPRLGHTLLGAGGGGGALRVAAAAAAAVEERDLLRGGARENGADLRRRVATLLLREPPAEAVVAAWWRADRSAKLLRSQAEDVAMEYRKAGGGGAGDELTAAFTAEAARRTTGSSAEEAVATCGALLAGGYHDRIAQRVREKENVFALANGRGASFASNTEPLVDSDYLVCLALDGGDKASARIQMACPLTLAELRRALGGGAIVCRDETFLAPSDGSVRRRRVERLGALALSDEPLPTPSPDEARPLLLKALRDRGLRRALLGGGQESAALELVARVRLMRALEPTRGWPEWSEDALLDGAEDEAGWLAPALASATSLKQLQRASVATLLEQSLPYALQTRLRECVPTSMAVPSGGTAKLAYVRAGCDPLAEAGEAAAAEGGGEAGVEAGEMGEALAPVLSSKLQEWFGASQTPSVGPPNNRLPVLLHLLSPAGRPIAITADLPSFWANGYPSARAELRDKYKRHPWPEDPAHAAPTRLSNRALAKQAATAERGGGGSDDARKAAAASGGNTRAGGGAKKKKKKKGGSGGGGGSGKFPLKRSNFKRR